MHKGLSVSVSKLELSKGVMVSKDFGVISHTSGYHTGLRSEFLEVT